MRFMSNTEKWLTAKEICSIINSCKSSNVKEFTFNSLNIKFGVEDKIETVHTHTVSVSDQGTPFESEVPRPQITEIDDALLAVENPLLWEERQIMGAADDE